MHERSLFFLSTVLQIWRNKLTHFDKDYKEKRVRLINLEFRISNLIKTGARRWALGTWKKTKDKKLDVIRRGGLRYKV